VGGGKNLGGRRGSLGEIFFFWTLFQEVKGKKKRGYITLSLKGSTKKNVLYRPITQAKLKRSGQKVLILYQGEKGVRWRGGVSSSGEKEKELIGAIRETVLKRRNR